jgi:hypothetical protein
LSNWRVEESAGGLRLSRRVVRSLGSEEYTWADLLYQHLASVQVYVLYFPSRFDLPVDTDVHTALTTFGQQIGTRTSVNFWDAADPEFGTALAFFQLTAPPALVLATGRARTGRKSAVPEPDNLFSIAITDSGILADREQLASAVNSAHDVLLRGDRREITNYVRTHDVQKLLEALATIAGTLRDEFLKFRPKVGLPGGISLQLG